MQKEIISLLKEFYILEKFQVAFYQAQSDSAPDEYYKKAFEKMVRIEQGHADYFAGMLQQINEDVPRLVGSLYEFAGNLTGETVESFGRHQTCKLGMILENHALKKYRNFIRLAAGEKQPQLKDTLMDYLLDEEFHTLWLRDYMEKYPE